MKLNSVRELLKLVAIFVLAGPAVGGLVMCVGITATVILPDILADPQSVQARGYLQTVALIMLFAYPLGVIPAAVTGVAQYFMQRRPCKRRLLGTLVVCVAGVAATWLQQLLLLDVFSVLPLGAAAVGAVVVVRFARMTCTKRGPDPEQAHPQARMARAGCR